VTAITIRFEQWPNALFENRFAIRCPGTGRQQALNQRYRDDDQTEKMCHDGKVLGGLNSYPGNAAESLLL